MQAVEVKLVALSLTTGPAGALIVSLTLAFNTVSTTAAGKAAEKEGTAAPVLPEPFKPLERYVCAGVRMWGSLPDLQRNLRLCRQHAGFAVHVLTVACAAACTCLHQELSVSLTLPAATCVYSACAAAGAASLDKHTKSSNNTLTCKLTVDPITSHIHLRLTSLGPAMHTSKAKGSLHLKVCCDFCWVCTWWRHVLPCSAVTASLKGLMLFALCTMLSAPTHTHRLTK